MIAAKVGGRKAEKVQFKRLNEAEIWRSKEGFKPVNDPIQSIQISARSKRGKKALTSRRGNSWEANRMTRAFSQARRRFVGAESMWKSGMLQ
jgi:hypothetical protein